MANLNAVLDKVNAVRVALGAAPLDRLPKGTTSNAQSCPLARAFQDVVPNATVGGGLNHVPRRNAHRAASAMGVKVSSSNGEATLDLPPVLSQFVQDFDRGYHPELNENRY